MSWLSSFMHPGRGYEAGQGELDKHYGEAQGYQQPYQQNGVTQGNNLSEYIKNFMDPEALQNKWSEGYKESPAAIQAEKMAQEHGMNAASSMGLMGSNTALNAVQSGTSQIGAEDKQNYLDNLMQKYMAGANLAQGMYGTGANAAGGMANTATTMGQNSADMAYGKKNAGGNMLGGLIGTGIGALGSAIGGGISKGWNTSGGR